MLIFDLFDISDLYLFSLSVPLNRVFKCFNNLLSSSDDRVTKETYNLASVTENDASVGSLTTGGLPTATATRVLT